MITVYEKILYLKCKYLANLQSFAKINYRYEKLGASGWGFIHKKHQMANPVTAENYCNLINAPPPLPPRQIGHFGSKSCFEF